jgi:hypothetical protein
LSRFLGRGGGGGRGLGRRVRAGLGRTIVRRIARRRGGWRAQRLGVLDLDHALRERDRDVLGREPLEDLEVDVWTVSLDSTRLHSQPLGLLRTLEAHQSSELVQH